MGKLTPGSNVFCPPRDNDLQQAHGSPPRFLVPNYVQQTSSLPTRHQHLHGVASAPQVTRLESLVEKNARQNSNPCHSPSADRPVTSVPQPQEQPPKLRGHGGTTAAAKTFTEPVSESNREWSSGGNKPRVKILLYGNDRDYFSAADIKYFQAICLTYVKGVHRDNIRVHHGRRPIGKEFDWFFNPNDITPGGLLILLVTGHGERTLHGVDLKTDNYGKVFMNTLDIHNGINKLQIPCTVEVVLGACNSEAVIYGLDRLLWMERSNTPERQLASLPSLGALFKTLCHHPSPKLATKAIVIVWAAAVDGGPAYEEISIPGKMGTNDIMIGAICRTLEFAGQTVPRKLLFEKIHETVSEYNIARDEKYLGETEEGRRKGRDSGKYRGPQLACLLSSPGNQEFVLNGFVFQALDGVGVADTILSE